MTDTRTASQEVQGEILNTVRKSQDAVVDAMRRWADAVYTMTPSMPSPSSCSPASGSSLRTCSTRPRR